MSAAGPISFNLDPDQWQLLNDYHRSLTDGRPWITKEVFDAVFLPNALILGISVENHTGILHRLPAHVVKLLSTP